MPGENPYEWTYDLAAVVTMEIKNTIPNLFDAKTKRTRAHRVIKKCTDAFLQEWKSDIVRKLR